MLNVLWRFQHVWIFRNFFSLPNFLRFHKNFQLFRLFHCISNWSIFFTLFDFFTVFNFCNICQMFYYFFTNFSTFQPPFFYKEFFFDISNVCNHMFLVTFIYLSNLSDPFVIKVFFQYLLIFFFECRKYKQLINVCFFFISLQLQSVNFQIKNKTKKIWLSLN